MITARDKFECAQREVDYRRRVYSRLVGDGKMTGGLAGRQIALMEAIAEDYRLQTEREEQEGRLL